jgi:nucleoredoxin
MSALMRNANLRLPHGGSTLPAAALEGKVIAFYFSASWCGPCQRFTPDLMDYYNTFKANHDQKDNFEIVLVSSDRDEAAYAAYHDKMPWPAVPFGHDLKAQLNLRFGIRGIPALVFVDADGTTLEKNGRATVARDPEG